MSRFVVGGVLADMRQSAVLASSDRLLRFVLDVESRVEELIAAPVVAVLIERSFRAPVPFRRFAQCEDRFHLIVVALNHGLGIPKLEGRPHTLWAD